MHHSSKKFFSRAVTIVAIFLVLVSININYYADYETRLLKGVYIHDGPSYLKAGNWSVPLVYDWDNDEKKDLLVGHNYIDENRKRHGYINFYKNTGSDHEPSFDGYSRIQICNGTCAPLDTASSG